MTKGSRVLLGLAWKLSLATAALALFMAIRSALYETGVDYQQGALFRLLYIHVPAAWFSLLLLITLATAQLVYSTTGARWLLKVLGVSLAIGLPCTVIVLATGLYWGRLIWGGVVYLDPRIVAQIFVLALYLVYALLRITKVYTLYVSATTWAATTALIVVNHFSVYWFNSIHQLPSVLRLDGSVTLHVSMREPLWWSTGFIALLTTTLLLRSFALGSKRT